METIPNRVEKIEQKYNFSEIEDLKAGLVSLCEQIKSNIDAGKYTLLLSDEVGGRVPTLVLRKIIKARNPANGVRTNFVASGKDYIPDKSNPDAYQKLLQHLKTITSPEDNILLVTQYIHSGETVQKLTDALHDTGLQSVDIVAVNSLAGQRSLSAQFPNDTLYIGSRDSSTYEFDDKTKQFAGVAKRKGEYEPVLARLEDVIDGQGREGFLSDEEWRNIFGIEKYEPYWEFKSKFEDPQNNAAYEARIKEPLSDDERRVIRENVTKAREDVETLANEIMEEVWHK